MNKTHNINLGGYPFTIDNDAYEHLQDYLNKIHKHFESSEGFEEIVDDIETRMAELLFERIKTKSIVTMDDVNNAISIMGTPEEFGAEAFGGESSSNGPLKRKYKTGKRLFRDPDDKIIGGLCSGLASYFGITEVLWVRIAFAVAALVGGIGLPLYLIMWAIVPEAKTPKDFLAMRGEPINVTNIAKIVEEQVEQISDQLSEIGNDWKSRRRKKKSEKRHKSSRDHH
jgi:phage shock protein PspC (stress-responsive transcriptional regulator)